MIKKRKQLMMGMNDDLVQDKEQNTNFLINKRKSRLRKTNDKLLFHTVNEGSIKGGIIVNGMEYSQD